MNKRHLLAMVGSTALAVAGCSDGRLSAFEVVALSSAGGGAGGAAGSAGQTQGGTNAVSGLLDDFEEPDNHTPADGWWYPNDDDTGAPAQLTFEAVTDRVGSQFVAHFHGGPTTDYGAFLGLDLPGGIYDASAFLTLSFFGRADPPLEISVEFLDPVSLHYRLPALLDTEWTEVRLPLTDFISADGENTALDPSSLTHLQFWVPGPSPVFDFRSTTSFYNDDGPDSELRRVYERAGAAEVVLRRAA